MDLRRSFGLVRMVVGVFSWIAPGLAARSFGLGSVSGDTRFALMGRIFGVRDFVLGGALLRAKDDAALSRALQMGLIVDSVDTVATALARRRGLGRAATVLVGGGAALFAGTGAFLLLRHRHDHDHDPAI